MAAVSGPSRRTVLAGAAAWLAAPSVRRVTAATPTLEAILAASGLSGITGFALADADGGDMIEAHGADAALPPASVAKVFTTLWALDALGAGHRFVTEIRADGPIADGVLAGDLALVGGGDPVFDTNALRSLVADLRAGGLRTVEGRLRVADGALPAIAEIDPGQPVTAGYNATIGGANLNFNRVFLAWTAGDKGPKLAFTAPGEGFAVAATGFAAEVTPDGAIGHHFEAGPAGRREVWSLPRPGLRGRGSVWLPVRAPAAYMGEILAALGGEAGLALPTPEVVAAAGGPVLARHASPPLDRMLRDMLRYSTNLTAECVGLRAAQARGVAPETLAGSAGAMAGWATARYGLAATALINHSGLSDACRTTPRDMLAVLTAAAGGALPDLLPEKPILDAARKPIAAGGVRVVAKTGTLDFASGLAGYVLGKRRLAFAIFAADAGRRARIRPEERADPPGADGWARRARAQQQALLRRWVELYA